MEANGGDDRRGEGAGDRVGSARKGDGRDGHGGGHRSIAEMVAEVEAAAAAAHEAAEAAAEVASCTAASADAAASAAKLASEAAKTTEAEARKASTSAAEARAAALEVAHKLACLVKALDLESKSFAMVTVRTTTDPDNGASEIPPIHLPEGEDSDPPIQHKITNVRELFATGLLEGERVVYQQKTRASDKHSKAQLKVYSIAASAMVRRCQLRNLNCTLIVDPTTRTIISCVGGSPCTIL